MPSIEYYFVEHIDPMANSHVPLMTITKRFGEHIAYQAVPVPEDGHPELLSREELKALFNEHRKYKGYR